MVQDISLWQFLEKVMLKPHNYAVWLEYLKLVSGDKKILVMRYLLFYINRKEIGFNEGAPSRKIQGMQLSRIVNWKTLFIRKYIWNVEQICDSCLWKSKGFWIFKKCNIIRQRAAKTSSKMTKRIPGPSVELLHDLPEIHQSTVTCFVAESFLLTLYNLSPVVFLVDFEHKCFWWS